ncbi:MAG: ATP-binding protein [Pseudomonadota bacterium]|nr:ATP-binding protein [Pseudomonadota bacterium]
MTKHGFSTILPADFDQVDDLNRRVKMFLSQKQIDLNIDDVLLGIREALMNAIRHGCANKPACKIVFSLSLGAECLVVKIEDQGPGFNWQQEIEKKMPELTEGGRGLHIIQLYFDSISYNATGNTIELKKYFIT